MKNTLIHKILIIRLSSIGDIVLTTAFVRLVRLKFPNAKIDFLLYSSFKSIFENNPHIDQIITCEKSENDTNLELMKSSIVKKQGVYDIIYDLHNNSMSNKISSGFGININKVNKRRIEKLKLVWLKKGIGEPYRRINDVYLDVGVNEEIVDDNLGLEFWLESDREQMQYLPHKRRYAHKGRYNIVIAPGAHFKTKQWNWLNYAHLIRKLLPFSDEITLIGGVNDISLADKIQELNPQVVNLCGKTDLADSCKVIDNSDFLITNDTGVMHIAAARKVPVVAFWGSSVRELGFEPFRSPNLIIESDVKCRPCSHIGKNYCSRIHFNCMNNITPDLAYNKIIDFIRSIYL